MGKKSKSSRKGKKAWRANISTEEIEDFYEKSNKDALSGGNLASAPNDDLFYVDKSKDLSVKRKIEKNREKVLRTDSILQKNPFVQPVPSSKKKSKKKQEKALKPNEPVHVDKKHDSPASGMVDFWDENKGECQRPARKHPHPCIAHSFSSAPTPTKAVYKSSMVPAVEVEPAGCSYNPTFESHQDMLAEAVAQEMQKVYKDELGPEPVPIMVIGDAIKEEDRFFLEVDNKSDDENEDDGEIDVTELEKRPSKTKQLTCSEVNRRAKRKEKERKEAEEKKVKDTLDEIDSLPEILHEIAKEDEEKQKRHLRRVTAKQERLKKGPPRLGKHKFEPAPVQVLLSEEITGSLRKLKGCCTLARDRFKSLEKRGLITPEKHRRK